jgi:3-phenylpropionate/trans-cinnamate dioxygenase ferredoxin reductase subunit
MGKICNVQINGETFAANQGDLLLDAALMSGIELPHDCRSGYCGTCHVRVLAGHAFGGATSQPDVIHACQARVISDMEIAVDNAVPVSEVSGHVSDLITVAPDVIEVCVKPAEELAYIPGQYLSVQFRGFPARCYSPTAPLDWPCDPDAIRFQVRQFPDGRVSSALGRKIVKGHKVTLTGPFGSAYFRPRNASRLVLISSGTGFAPIWAVAEAAIREWPERELVLIAGARSLESLYMIPALCRLALFPRVTIIPVVSARHGATRAVQSGRPPDYLPALSADDVVYAAGAPAMIEAVTRIAGAAGAKLFADPFEPASNSESGTNLFARAAQWFAPTVDDSPSLSMSGWTDQYAERKQTVSG